MVLAIARPRLEGNVAVGQGRQIGFAEFGEPQGRAVFWLHGTPGARRQIPTEARVYAANHGAGAALALGRQLRTEIEQSIEPTGVLVVADGAYTLTPAAPGGYHPADADVQLALDDALGSGDLPTLARLPEQVVGRVALQVLAGLAEPAPRSAKELYRAAPFGVGYFAGVWQP